MHVAHLAAATCKMQELLVKVCLDPFTCWRKGWGFPTITSNCSNPKNRIGKLGRGEGAKELQHPF